MDNDRLQNFVWAISLSFATFSLANYAKFTTPTKVALFSSFSIALQMGLFLGFAQSTTRESKTALYILAQVFATVGDAVFTKVISLSKSVIIKRINYGLFWTSVALTIVYKALACNYYLLPLYSSQKPVGFLPFKAAYACLFLLYSLLHLYVLFTGPGAKVITMLLNDAFRRTLVILLFAVFLIAASVEPLDQIKGNVQVLTNPVQIVLKQLVFLRFVTVVKSDAFRATKSEARDLETNDSKSKLDEPKKKQLASSSVAL